MLHASALAHPDEGNAGHATGRGEGMGMVRRLVLHEGVQGCAAWVLAIGEWLAVAWKCAS